MNDNCVSYRTLKLQIPESRMRPHFVKARVKVHVKPDGSHASSMDPAASAARREGSHQRCEKRRLNRSAASLWTAGTSLRLAVPPTGEQKEKKRTNERYQNGTS